MRENQILSDDLISLVGQAEPRGFSDLSSWVSNITYVGCVCLCVCVTDASEVTMGEKKNASEDEGEELR